jgi:hypothetical protein
MTRTAPLIATVGILTALVCLPLAAALHRSTGGTANWWDDLAAWGDWDDENDSAGSANIEAREFPWGDSDRLEVQVPATVHFVPAPAWHLSIRGPSRTLDRLSVSNGHIGLRDSGPFHHHHAGSLDIELAGPALHEIGVDGSGTLTLDSLKQDTLDIRIRGSGSARANGSVDALKLVIMGSGSARMEHLTSASTVVRIAGSGDADIGPTQDADVEISGSGDVRLHSQPKRLRSQVHGSGRIVELPEAEPAAAVRS